MKRIILIVFAVAAVAALVPGASKAEPKNQWPFTAVIQAPAAHDTGSGSAARQGYTTAGPPQPGQVGYLNYGGGSAVQGEAKNEPPFTNAVVTPSNGIGSDWIELTLGAIAIVLVVGVAFGVVQLSRHAAAKPVA